jgi:hypothetical protein
MKKILSLLFVVGLIAVTHAATPTVGFFTGSGNGWSNLITAGVSAKIGLWPVALIYNTKSSLSNAVALAWDRSPDTTNNPAQFTNVTYRVYWGDINAGTTNMLFCSTNQYAVFWNLNTNVTYFWFATAKDEAGGLESEPSSLVVAKPSP